MEEKVDLIDMTADIVSAYVSNNTLPPTDLPHLIETVHTALAATMNGAARVSETLIPAVPVAASVTDEFIICLEDGKQFKSLKRHLSSQYDMTPGEYRTRWQLPTDYPMVAPNYAKARSELAKKLGLGRKAEAKRKGKPS